MAGVLLPAVGRQYKPLAALVPRVGAMTCFLSAVGKAAGDAPPPKARLAVGTIVSMVALLSARKTYQWTQALQTAQPTTRALHPRPASLPLRPTPRHGGFSWARVKAALQPVALLVGCGLIAAQYGLLQIFGVYSQGLAVAAGLSTADVSLLYTAMNWGACALAFLAGLVFDRYGAAGASLVGGVVSSGSMLLILAVLRMRSSSLFLLLQLAFLAFGFGASCLNTVAVVGAVQAVPPRHAGRASAGVLCFLALSMSWHVAIFHNVCEQRFFSFVWYQAAYSFLAGLLGFLIFATRPPAAEASADAGTAPLLDVEQRQEAKATAPLPKHTLLARLRVLLGSKEMPWLVALFMGPLAYSFSLLGTWSVCASRLSMPAGQQAQAAYGIGIASAIGRLVFGGLADMSPVAWGRLGWELCCAGSILAFLIGFALLEHSQRGFFATALWIQSFAYGGIMALAPASLRVNFLPEDMGLVYGILFQTLAIAFTVLNQAAVPSPECMGPLCFQGWFRATGAICAVCLVWSLKRCVAAWQRLRVPPPPPT